MLKRIPLLMVIVGLCPAGAMAALLDATTSLNALTLPIPLAGGTQNVTVNGSGVYDFADRNGDGTLDDAVTPGGLTMAGYSLTTTDGTAIKLSLNSGSITGNSGLTAISTFRNLGASTSGSTGAISITNAGNLSLGIINSGRRSTGTSSAVGTVGSITIGSLATPVGEVRVDALYTNNYNTADINNGYTYSKTGGGSLAVYGSGDVFVKDSGGTLGNVVTWSHGSSSGLITIRHDGGFSAAGIFATAGGVYTSTQKVNGASFNGDADGDGADGDFYVAGDMLFAQVRTTYGDPNGNITITGYRNVTIGGNVYTYHASSQYTDNHAGDLTVTAIGNIVIGGAFDMHVSHASAQPGDLSLTTTGIGKTITLASLDLTLMKVAILSADGGATVTGALVGFDTGSPGTSKLNVATGKFVYYNPSVTENGYLGGATYTTTGGGTLTPIVTVPEPATMTMLGLGGLVLAAGAVRRRRRAMQ